MDNNSVNNIRSAQKNSTGPSWGTPRNNNNNNLTLNWHLDVIAYLRALFDILDQLDTHLIITMF